MKKTILLLLTIVIAVFPLSSCGKTYMHVYDNDEIGLHYELPRNFEYYKYGARGTITYRNKAATAAVVIELRTEEEITESSAFDTMPTLEEFIDYTVSSQALGEIEIHYNEAKTRATFDLNVSENEESYGQYIYYTMIKNERGIYIIEMLCQGIVYENYAPQFISWSNSIYAY